MISNITQKKVKSAQGFPLLNRINVVRLMSKDERRRPAI